MDVEAAKRLERLEALLPLVRAMRAKQRAYFKGRRAAALVEARTLERQVDDLVAELTGSPPLDFMGPGAQP